MGESIKQYIKALGYRGAIVTAFLVGDILGIIKSYVSVESGNFLLPVWVWWLILVVILIISPFWVFHKLRLKLVSVENDRKKLLDARPSIDVTLEKTQTSGGHINYLRVHNNGAEGEFRAQIELSSDDPSVLCLPHYYGYWQYGNKDATKISKGHDDWLKIAELKSSPPSYSIEHLEIFFYDKTAGCAHPVSTSSYFIGVSITNKDGNTKPMTKWDYKLRVSISSNPELREGVFCRDYILNIDELRESNSLLNSRTVGSQTL